MPKATDREWLKGRNKFVTGFCNDINKPAQCEGTKPKSYGKPLTTCSFYLTCPCDCHYRLDKLFETVGKERQLIPNPEYVPEKLHFVLPEPTYEDPLGNVALAGVGVIEPSGLEGTTALPPAAPSTPLAARRTPTGRAARGGLEAQVWEQAQEFVSIGADPMIMTPKTFGMKIADRYKIPTPSSGAINAVWDRWAKIGFAEKGSKPVRFVKFCGEGTWAELESMKSKTRREKKNAESLKRRGYR